jgi:uncharacterized SAM-binding protein YcdF (DUF218 family)
MASAASAQVVQLIGVQWRATRTCRGRSRVHGPAGREAAIGIVYGAATIVALAVFVVRVLREPRRLSNAVWLGITLMLALLCLTAEAAGMEWLAQILRYSFLVVVLAVSLVLPAALIVNGVVMWRREGRRIANLLSLLVGLGLVGVVAVFVFASPSDVVWINASAGSILLLFAYLAFLFCCLLVYSLLYSRIGRRTGVAAIVVPGSGLLGDKVPPLLAGRLDRAASLYRREVRSGMRPVIVVSGGQGPGETTTEAAAMRAHLIDHGLPEDQVLVEDQATTTKENLRLSADLLARHGHAGPAIAVTNNYHVFRTAVIARQLKLTFGVMGAPTALYFLPSAFLREFAALIAQYRRTNIAVGLILVALPWILTFALPR